MQLRLIVNLCISCVKSTLHWTDMVRVIFLDVRNLRDMARAILQHDCDFFYLLQDLYTAECLFAG